ncbi:hypothetical protein XH94_03080, partial [Bradyrhizobium zhanjiangense]
MLNSFRCLQHTLIDEDEALGIKRRLALEPILAPLYDVRPAGPARWRVRSFFARDAVPHQEATECAFAEH